MSIAEGKCKWHFAQSLGGQEQGPKEATSENFKKDPYDSLVRESIQNSLDARQSDELPVIVSFRFKGTDSHNYPQLFALRDHIQSCIDTYNDDNSRKKFQPMLDYLDKASQTKIDYLEVSDENTTGMAYERGNRKCPFHSFVKSVGNSSKSSNSAGGSYGFGKAAFYLVSNINAVLVSTLTQDNKYYFEGVSSLCSHEMNGMNYVPVGFYCDNDQEFPVELPTEIPVKFRRKEIGSSVFIMGLGLDDNSRIEAIKKINEAVVRHFWFALLRSKLIVRVGIGGSYYELNSSTLLENVEKIFPTFDDLKRGHKNPRPYIEAVANAGQDDKHLLFEKEIPMLGSVQFYMLKTKSGNDYILNMRKPLMLVNHDLNRSQYGFYSVFVCTDEDGNEILRKGENAQHTEWDPCNAANSIDKQQVRDALRMKDEFIQECIRSVFISEDSEVLTFGGLDDFLTIPSSLDEDEEFNLDFGKRSGETTDEESTSATTELKDIRVHKTKIPTLGEVRIKKKKKKRQIIDDDGDDQQTGHEPEQTPEIDPQPDPNPEPEPTPEPEPSPEPEPDPSPEPEPNPEPEDEGENTNTGPEEPMVEDEDFGTKTPRLKPLRISYRAFAQQGDEGIVHRLVIHSNRSSDNVVIALISGGESSDEALAIRKTDNGNIVGNQLTKVHIDEGKTYISVWFADDMRHAIKLNVHEDQ